MSAYDDLVVSALPATFISSGNYPASTKLPNGDAALVCGLGKGFEVASNPTLSIPYTGTLTVEAWLLLFSFPATTGSGYVHWLGKGEQDKQEWALRLYGPVADRPYRVSCYAFNPIGGLGSGAYFQDPLLIGQWMHIVASYQAEGMIKIYRDGVLRDTKPMSQYNVVPLAGNAPVRIGTRDGLSWVDGAIGKVAIYNHLLTDTAIKDHYDTMMLAG